MGRRSLVSVPSLGSLGSRASWALVFGLVTSGAGRASAADDKESCVAASGQAQTLRDEGRYGAARAAMFTCARDVCPAVVRRECERWLVDLEAAQPTLVLGARDPKGNDYAGVRVLLDGAPFVARLDGKPVAVDPGEHVLRYEAPGASAVEQRVIVRVNEKNRTLTAILMPSEGRAPTAVPPPAAAVPARSSDSRVPLPTWVFGGIAIVAAGSFAGFGLSGQGDVSNLRTTCAPSCAQGQVDSAKAKLVAADVSLGVGVVSLAAAAWYFFRRDSVGSGTATVTFDAEPRRGGGVATVAARF